MTARPRVAAFVALLALVAALLGGVAARADAQTAPEGEWMPLVGSFTLWCTWSGNGGPCDVGEIHHTTPAIDLAAEPGTPVYAVGDGEVVRALGGCDPLAGDGCNNGAGNYVVIDHGDHRSRYLHLSTISVGLGPVEAGTQLGTTGNSGSTAHPHLHYDETTDESFGDRIDLGSVAACHGEEVVSYPDVLGVSSWADVPYGSTIRNDGYECLGGTTIVVEPPTPAATRYVPVAPVRLFDTRNAAEPSGALAPGETIDVQVSGRAGIPTDAVAVVLNVTITDPPGEGFVTVWPHGQQRPLASSLNVVEQGQTVANLVTVPLGSGGRVDLFSQGGGHLLADVAGYYVPTDEAVSSGRLVAQVPTRLFDTRLGGGDPVGARSAIEVGVAGRAGLPDSGIAAVVLNVTATDAAAAGHVSVWPTGSPRPTISNLNLNEPRDTVPALVVVPLGDDGSVSFYAHAGAHLLADVMAYITDESAEASRAGLFVPVDPYRVFDTRDDLSTAAYVSAESAIEVGLTGDLVVPDDAAGVMLNVTGTDPADAGFVTAWPAAAPRPLASTLNLSGADDTRANAAILQVGADGAVAFYAHRGAHLLADLSGYYLAE